MGKKKKTHTQISVKYTPQSGIGTTHLIPECPPRIENTIAPRKDCAGEQISRNKYHTSKAHIPLALLLNQKAIHLLVLSHSLP